MDIEFKIGREVDGANALQVPSQHKKVSRHHATIFWHDGMVTIVDNDSTNGTYVNGKRVAKTKISDKDTVWLGSNGESSDAYQLDMPKIFEKFRKVENANRTDYTQEFQSIRQAYIDYQREVSSLSMGSAKQAMMPKLLATIVPALLGLLAFIVLNNNTVRILAVTLGSVTSSIVGVLTLPKNAKDKERIAEETISLQIKSQSKYSYPKCGMKFPFTMHWKKIEAEGKCPNPKCNAVFVKK